MATYHGQLKVPEIDSPLTDGVIAKQIERHRTGSLSIEHPHVAKDAGTGYKSLENLEKSGASGGLVFGDESPTRYGIQVLTEWTLLLGLKHIFCYRPLRKIEYDVKWLSPVKWFGLEDNGRTRHAKGVAVFDVSDSLTDRMDMVWSALSAIEPADIKIVIVNIDDFYDKANAELNDLLGGRKFRPYKPSASLPTTSPIEIIVLVDIHEESCRLFARP
jgi:hypothetical protein